MCCKSMIRDPWLYFPSEGPWPGLNLLASDPVASMINTGPPRSTKKKLLGKGNKTVTKTLEKMYRSHWGLLWRRTCETGQFSLHYFSKESVPLVFELPCMMELTWDNELKRCHFGSSHILCDTGVVSRVIHSAGCLDDEAGFVHSHRPRIRHSVTTWIKPPHFGRWIPRSRYTRQFKLCFLWYDASLAVWQWRLKWWRSQVI